MPELVPFALVTEQFHWVINQPVGFGEIVKTTGYKNYKVTPP